MTVTDFSHDSLGGGAWPFLVGGLVCLVYSVNERDLGYPVRFLNPSRNCAWKDFVCQRKEVRGHNRSVMPFDVLGCTRATLMTALRRGPASEGMGDLLTCRRDWTSFLKFWKVNEEFLVSASHKLALDLSLPFVHTARRSYR